MSFLLIFFYKQQLVQESFDSFHLNIYIINIHEMYSNLQFFTTFLQNIKLFTLSILTKQGHLSYRMYCSLVCITFVR